MGGICGFSGSSADETLTAMISALRHRGPAAAGILTAVLDAPVRVVPATTEAVRHEHVRPAAVLAMDSRS